MGRSSKAEVSSDAATSASSAGTAGAPAATPRPTSAGDDAQGRCATMMPMSAVAVVLAGCGAGRAPAHGAGPVVELRVRPGASPRSSVVVHAR